MCEEFWQPGFTDADDQNRYYTLIGELLMLRRYALGINEQAMSDYLGISPQRLQRFENGEEAIPLWYFSRLCRILQFDYNCRSAYLP